jgi:hypothetical protein
MICEVLGLNPHKTRSININMTTGKVVTVTAEIYPDKRELEIIKILMEEFMLVPRGEVFNPEEEMFSGQLTE